jgi:hypothetical protein
LKKDGGKDGQKSSTKFDPDTMTIMWVQRKHKAADQSFDPYILLSRKSANHVMTSYRATKPVDAEDAANGKNSSATERNPLASKPKAINESSEEAARPETLTSIAILLGVMGFIAQFQGLRLSNWSCSIAQLVAMFLATIMRAIVRRHMTSVPHALLVPDGHELDALAYEIMGSKGFQGEEGLRSSPFNPFWCGVVHAHPVPTTLESNYNRDDTATEQLVRLRAHLGLITRWEGSKSDEAKRLSSAINIVTRLFDFSDAGIWTNFSDSGIWIHLNIGPSLTEKVFLPFYKFLETAWKVDTASLEAILSLDAFGRTRAAGMKPTNPDGAEDTSHADMLARNDRAIFRFPDWLKDSDVEFRPTNGNPYVHVLGESEPGLENDLSWWLPDREGGFSTFDPTSIDIDLPKLGYFGVKKPKTQQQGRMLIVSIREQADT